MWTVKQQLKRLLIKEAVGIVPQEMGSLWVLFDAHDTGEHRAGIMEAGLGKQIRALEGWTEQRVERHLPWASSPKRSPNTEPAEVFNSQVLPPGISQLLLTCS